MAVAKNFSAIIVSNNRKTNQFNKLFVNYPDTLTVRPQRTLRALFPDYGISCMLLVLLRVVHLNVHTLSFKDSVCYLQYSRAQ